MITLSGFLFLFNSSWLALGRYILDGIKALFLATKGLFTGASKRIRRVRGYVPPEQRAASVIWQYIYWIIDIFSNYNSMYFQPMLFSLPVVYIVFENIINDKEYMNVYYRGNSDTADMNDSLTETIGQRERAEAVNQETDNSACGVVGNIIAAVLSVAMNVVNNALGDFVLLIDDVYSAAGDFLEILGKLVEIDRLQINLQAIEFLGEFMQNVLIYAIPMGCTGVLIAAWVQSLVYVPTKQYLAYISMGVFIASTANLLIHQSFGGIMAIISDFEMPFITLQIEMSSDHYMTQLCSLLNIASVIVIALNYFIPIPDKVLTDHRYVQVSSVEF